MAEKIVLTTPEPAATEWVIERLEIAVNMGIVEVTIRADNGQFRRYSFDNGTDPTGTVAMNAINVHNGLVKPLHAWILERLQAMDSDLAGQVVSE